MKVHEIPSEFENAFWALASFNYNVFLGDQREAGIEYIRFRQDSAAKFENLSRRDPLVILVDYSRAIYMSAFNTSLSDDSRDSARKEAYRVAGDICKLLGVKKPIGKMIFL